MFIFPDNWVLFFFVTWHVFFENPTFHQYNQRRETFTVSVSTLVLQALPSLLSSTLNKKQKINGVF